MAKTSEKHDSKASQGAPNATAVSKPRGRNDTTDTIRRHRPRSARDKKLRSNLNAIEAKYKTFKTQAQDSEILLANRSGLLAEEGPLERTYKVRQDEIKDAVGVETVKKSFDLKLDTFGPYFSEYTRNGRHLLLGSRKGHVAAMDWRSGRLACEMHLNETVRDAKWLHNELFFAVAQKRNVFIYSGSDGVELHNMRDHEDVTHMEFLPYHFLLATIGHHGYLKYHDTSIGQMVAQMPTKLGSPTAFGQNPHNAIIHSGHQNGVISLWSPNSTTPLAKILAHKAPVRSLAVDREGRYMVSTGQDLRMAVWDIRTFKEVNTYFTRQPGSTLAISDTNLAALGWGTQISIWRGLFDKSLKDQEKVQSPYLGWAGEGRRIERVRWCPLEDTLGVSHDSGFSSIIVPGAGEPNFDSLEANPYETVRERQEGEVKALLNKLQPEMISLNPDYIGNVDVASVATRKAEGESADRSIQEKIDELEKGGNNKKSKGALRRYLRKKQKQNIVDEHRLRIEEHRQQKATKAKQRLEEQQQDLGPALARFARKGDF